MSQCISCNKTLQKNFKACPYCGTKVNSRSCSSCGQQLKDDYKFCPNCAAPVKTLPEIRSTLETLVGSAKGHAKLGHHKEAIADYTRSIELDPEYRYAHRNRGWSHAKLGNQEEAIADFTRAIELDPEDEYAYRLREEVIADQTRHPALDADPLEDLTRVEDLIRAIESDPEYKLSYFNRGNSHAGLGNHKEAIADFTKAIELDPRDKAAYHQRALCHRALGD